MEKYGNYEIVKGKQGEFGVVRLPDGLLYEAWYVYYKETNLEYFEQWVKNRLNIFDINHANLVKGMVELKEGKGVDRPDFV
jgi:hypothetical protein